MGVVQTMTEAIDTGLSQPAQPRGAAMEAHAGSITIGTGRTARPRRRVLSQFRGALRRRRIERAERAYALRMNGERTGSVQGSEHTHLLNRPRGF